ncbi:MAG: helix-turn-helix transcriptional regulator [Clostridia bacterium]|nr:helix-turn-helix transcriptional regulator [Clostridia bacterium]
MLTHDQVNFIKQYVTEEYYDTEKLLSYLNIHNVVGNEIFDLVIRKNTNRNVKCIEYEYGFSPVPVDVFVKRIPFYFYVCDYYKKEFGSLSSIIYDMRWNEHREHDYEHMYIALEKLLYEYKLKVPDIFSYIVNQHGPSTGNSRVLFMWIEYLEMCQSMNIDNKFPESITYAYNDILERTGKEPIIYMPGLVGFNENFLRIDNEIIVGGQFPCDSNNIPALKWIGVWIENAEYVKATNCYSMGRESNEKELHIGLNPKTKIYLPNIYNDDDDNEDVWYLIYTGSYIMELDRTALKFYRNYRGMKQQQIADAVGVQLRTYQKWEKGETIPDGENLIKLMNCLNIPSVQDFIKNDPIYDNNFTLFRNRENYGLKENDNDI